MKRLLSLSIFFFFFTAVYSAENIFRVRTDSTEVKKWTREEFVKEFGVNDSAKALINLFFAKSKRGKNQAIIGSALLSGGIIALSIPDEPGNDAKGFGDLIQPVAEPGAVTLGALLAVCGINKLRKYSLQKLYFLLSGYKNGTPIPQKYKRKLRSIFFSYRKSIVPRF